MHSAEVFVACVAIVSARVRLESWDESKKQEWREGGEGREGNPTFVQKLDCKHLLHRLKFSAKCTKTRLLSV